jgi:hypothetical protein
MDPDTAVWKNHDVLYAVDTNTVGAEPQRISVAVGHRCQRVIHLPGGSSSFIEEYPYCFEFHNVSREFNPEVIGWVEVIRRLLKSEDYESGKRIGLIVDSEYRLHKLINARTIPMHGILKLPERITMIYASSDTSRDRTANKLISNADKVSGQILARLRSGDVPLATREAVSKPYQRIRRIRLQRADSA